MKSILRNLAVVTVILVAFFACNSISIYRQYTWLDKSKREAAANGWTLVTVSDNYSVITEPWTIVKPPANMAIFTKTEEIRRMGDTLVGAPTLWMHNHALVDEKDELRSHMADCRTKKLAFVDSTMCDMSVLKWNSYEEGMPGNGLVTYLCASSK